MAWETCPWCGQRNNGDSKSRAHKRAEHPLEFRRSELEWESRSALQSLENDKKRLNNWRAYHAFLNRTGEPAEINELVAAAFKRLDYKPHYMPDDMTVEEYLAEWVDAAFKRWDEAQKALEAFDQNPALPEQKAVHA